MEKEVIVAVTNMSTKDYFQIGTWAIGIFVGCLALYKGLVELAQSRTLRERELRWSKAKVAKDMLSEFELKGEYQRSCRMLDWKKCSFQINQELSHAVSRAEVLHALRADDLIFTEKEKYIRESFIEFFNCFEWLEHFIDRELIGIEDVKPVLSYRVKSMVDDKNVFEVFLKKYGYSEALRFLDRFSSWANANASQ